MYFSNDLNSFLIHKMAAVIFTPLLRILNVIKYM